MKKAIIASAALCFALVAPTPANAAASTEGPDQEIELIYESMAEFTVDAALATNSIKFTVRRKVSKGDNPSDIYYTATASHPVASDVVVNIPIIINYVGGNRETVQIYMTLYSGQTTTGNVVFRENAPVSESIEMRTPVFLLPIGGADDTYIYRIQ